MDMNYILLPEDYLPPPPPADTANDDEMDVDEVPMGEAMEVDEVEVRPKRRMVRVTVHLPLLPLGEPMEVDPVPAQPWPVLSRPAWNIDVSECAKISPALIVGGTRVSRRTPQRASPPRTTVPEQAASVPNPQAERPAVNAHPVVNMTKVATSSKVKLEDMPLPSASVAVSSRGLLDIAQDTESKETIPRRTRQTRFASPLSPVKQSKIDDDLFVRSSRQSPDLIIDNHWLRISRTPGRNIDNESVFEGSDADYSPLASAYPPDDDTDIVFPKIERFSPVRHARMDESFFLTSNRQTPDLAVKDRWLKISRTPDHNIFNINDELTATDEDETDHLSLAIAYPPSENTDDSSLDLDFAEAETSFNWGTELITPETPRRIRRTKLFSPLSPVRQSNLDDDDLFIRSNRQTPDLITSNRWLKISRTPGRNIDNESVFSDDEYADYSYLALAYPSIEESDTSSDEKTFSTSLASDTSGYLADDSFSFFSVISHSSSLASSDSFDYLADVSCTFLEDSSDGSEASMADVGPCCETVSEAAQADLPSSSSMDLLIATLSNLVIDEGLEVTETNEAAADHDGTTSESCNTWQTAEESVLRDDTAEDAAVEVLESYGEEGAATMPPNNEESTDEGSFNSGYPSSLSSGNGTFCFCNSDSCSNGVGQYPTSHNASTSGFGSEAEVLEDVGPLVVEGVGWDMNEPEEEANECEEGEGQPQGDLAWNTGTGNKEFLARLSVEPGSETELDVNELEDDLKYIYSLPH